MQLGFAISLILLSLSYSTASFTDILEYPQSLYQATIFFVINPALDILKDIITRYPLLPDDIHNYDAFGNFIADARDILKQKYYSKKMQNYTEKFKLMYDSLYIGRGEITDDGWDDPKDNIRMPRNTNFDIYEFHRKHSERKRNSISQFSYKDIEESAEYWEFKGSEDDHPIESMPKTFSTFPNIKIPKRSRFAHVLETYLIDLCRLFYPFIEESDLDSFDDLLTLILFHLYIHLNEKGSDLLYRAYAKDLIEDLRYMGTVLTLNDSLNRMTCLQDLIEDVINFGCFYTFQLMIQSKMLNINSSTLIKHVLLCGHDNLIKYFLRIVDRNVEIDNIVPNCKGKLCHGVYWIDKEWIMLELLKYEDVNWDAVDSRGYTVLGYMIHSKMTLDERYRMFLKHTNTFITCFENGEDKRNILEECLILKEDRGDRYGRRGLSKFVTYLKERKHDDYSPLLVSAALKNRSDYFDRILEHRTFNYCHELDSAFQFIYHHMKQDRLYLYSFLVIILVRLQRWHGKKGYNLEHIFFMKWEIQLARFRAVYDEMGIEIKDK